MDGNAERPIDGAAPPNAFEAELEIIGINPFVNVPEPALEAIFAAAGSTTATSGYSWSS